LKLDFEKAFDKFEHKVISLVQQHKGFPRKWLKSIRDILASSTSSVLLNDVPGKVFHCRRYVRQGDPLSPLLFILAAHLLQTLINKAKEMGLLRLPIQVGYTLDFPIIQYADDMLLVMEACPHQLLVLKAILNTFADSTGLKVNYSKSNMFPINLSPERLNHFAATFNCQASSLPFTYLGLPLINTKPTVQEFLPLVHRVERRLISTAMFLTQGGKLHMVKSVLSSLPTFFMSTLKVPIVIINQIDCYRRHCLWRGGDLNAKKPPLAAWKMVCKPKRKRGLGVIKLRLQNDALLLKNLDKFFSRDNLPWVNLIWSQYYNNGHILGNSKKGSFWWRSILKLLTSYKGLAKADYGNGETILFWHDLWNVHVMKASFPHLHSFAKSDVITVISVLQLEHFQDHFNLPLSEIAFEQFCEVSMIIQSLQMMGSWISGLTFGAIALIQ
jgi:hypothetical protein